MQYVRPVSLLEGRLVFAYVADVSITLFLSPRWSDEDIRRLLDETTTLGHDETARATVSRFYGEIFGAHQRKVIVDWLAGRGLSPSPRNALLTDSQLMRGALTAYAWLTQAENRAFEPKETRAICDWVTRGLVAKPDEVADALEGCYRLADASRATARAGA